MDNNKTGNENKDDETIGQGMILYNALFSVLASFFIIIMVVVFFPSNINPVSEIMFILLYISIAFGGLLDDPNKINKEIEEEEVGNDFEEENPSELIYEAISYLLIFAIILAFFMLFFPFGLSLFAMCCMVVLFGALRSFDDQMKKNKESEE